MKVDKAGVNDCWPWMAYRDKQGYGRINVRGKLEYSHHVAWFTTHKARSIMHVLHKCGNCFCCNPNHLYEGTPQQNADDRKRHAIERGTYKAPKPFHSVFTHTSPSEARQIVELAASGKSVREIQQITGRSRATINRIRFGYGRQHLVVADNIS